MSYPIVKLGEICTIHSGGTPSRTKPEYWGGSIPWVKISDMLQNEIITTDERITNEGLQNSSAKIIPKNTLLLSIFATVGRVALLKIDASTNQAIVGIVIKDELLVDKNYLKFILKSKTEELKSQSRGVAQTNINISILSALEILLPPLAEQQRIAAILDKAELVKRKRELAIEKLDELAQSVFNKMFSADIKNSKSKVADFFVINDNKLNIRMNDEELIPFVPMAAVSEITKSVFDIQFRNFKEVKKGYTPIKKGDLIIAKITPCYENGKMALVNEITNDFAFGSTEFHTIRADNPNYLYLLFYYLDSEVIRKGGALNMKGAAGQRRVPAEYFSKLPFCIPIEEQITKFVKIINKIKYERKIHCDSLDSICSFQHSLQSKAFSGQL